MSRTPLHYLHVDVFAPRPYAGNSLAVFPDALGLTAAQMLAITQELRHFETIFLQPTDDPRRVQARVFDLATELPFAGHPLLGAAAALHLGDAAAGHSVRRWTIVLASGEVVLRTRTDGAGVDVELSVGAPDFLGVVGDEHRERVAGAFSLTPEDLAPGLPLEVVSTGLRYLVVPLVAGLDHAAIAEPIDDLLAGFGAEFAYLIDVTRLEGRHWNNDGLTEDVATGSAATCVAAWLRRHGRCGSGERVTLRQGRHVGRPSVLDVRAFGDDEAVEGVMLGGAVSLVARGTLERLP